VLADGSWELNATGAGAAGAADVLRMEASTIARKISGVWFGIQGLSGGTAQARLGVDVARKCTSRGTGCDGRGFGWRAECQWSATDGWGSFAEAVAAGADAAATLPNAWLMLERTGDSVRCSVSSDGLTYRPVAACTLTGLASSLQVGLFRGEW